MLRLIRLRRRGRGPPAGGTGEVIRFSSSILVTSGNPSKDVSVSFKVGGSNGSVAKLVFLASGLMLASFTSLFIFSGGSLVRSVIVSL